MIHVTAWTGEFPFWPETWAPKFARETYLEAVWSYHLGLLDGGEAVEPPVPMTFTWQRR